MDSATTFNIDDKVIFGTAKGEQTRGTVVGFARGRFPYKVRQDEPRNTRPVGTIWKVTANIMRLDPDPTRPIVQAPAPVLPAVMPLPGTPAVWRRNDRAEYLHGKGQRRIIGTITKVFGTKARLVEDGNDGSRWWNIPLNLLRPTAVPAPLPGQTPVAAPKAPSAFTPPVVHKVWAKGTRVAFEARGMTIVGTVVKINPATVRVMPDTETDPRRSWTCNPDLLRPADASVKAMKYSVGQRVEVKPLFSKEWIVGTVKGFNQQYQRYEVFAGGDTHRYLESEVRPFSGTRTKDQIMADFSAAYNHLSPENISCDGEASRAHVNQRRGELSRWLRELAAENGGMVSEEESYQWDDAHRKAGTQFRF